MRLEKTDETDRIEQRLKGQRGKGNKDGKVGKTLRDSNTKMGVIKLREDLHLTIV